MPRRRPSRIQRLPHLALQIDPSVERRFRRQAVQAFPRETLAYLFGYDLGARMEIVDLWTPPADLTSATSSMIEMADHVDWEAFQAAREADLQVLGDLHTHPWNSEQADIRRNVIQTSTPIQPSAVDWDDRAGLRWLTGICLVEQSQSGRLRCRFRYWGPLTPIVRL